MQFKEIQKQVESVIKHSQHLECDIDCTSLMTDWLEAKRDFIEAFGGKPIFEYPEKVYFELGPREKKLRVSDFIEMVENKWDNYALARFLEVQKEGFFQNRVIEDYTIDWNGVQIAKGMKLLKSFKFFETDKDILNDMQSAASMIIQEDKIEGILCLSVHPLDYLSSSENNHNWRSCHALDGEYRAGNLSYMVDSSTIVAYLKSPGDEILPNFPSDVLWNSKKWRVLLFLSERWDMVFAGRQYPFHTDVGINMVKNVMLPQTHIGRKWSDWDNYKIRSVDTPVWMHSMRSPYIPMNSCLIQMKDLIQTRQGSLFFNDLLNSSCYDPIYSYQMSGDFGWVHPQINSNTRFVLGGSVKCPCCNNRDLVLTESMLCPDCEESYGDCMSDDFATCDCCGRRYYYEDGTYVEDADETVCPSCAAEHVGYCEHCDVAVYKNDLIFDRKTGEYVCQNCYDNSQIEEEPRETVNSYYSSRSALRNAWVPF